MNARPETATPSLLEIALFYAEAGCDEAIGEQPVDRTVAPPARTAPAAAMAATRAVAQPNAARAGPMPGPAGGGPALLSAQAIETAASQAARACRSIAELEAAIRVFE